MNRFLFSMRHSRRTFIRFLLGATVLGYGAHLKAFAQEGQKRGGILRAGVKSGGAAEPLDPLVVSGARTMSFLLWDRLTWIDTAGEVQPELATSWEVSSDLKQWKFELRNDVKFHDGRPLTARDVVFTFSRALDPAKGGQPYGLFSPYLDSDSVIAETDHTVVFNLKLPLYDLDALVAGDQLAIVPNGDSDEEIRSKGMGTGPFVLKEYEPQTHLIARRNENYWRKGFPLLDGVDLYKVPEPTQAVAGLLSGQFDLVTELTPVSVQPLKGRGEIQVHSVPSGNTAPIFMIADAEPFDDNRVRLAFKKAVDRERIIQQVFLGEATVGNDQPIPSVSPLSAQLPPIERDIEGAKKLLAEAGYPDGLDIEMHTTNWCAEMAVVFAETVREAGIRVTLSQEPPGTYVALYNKGEFPLFNSTYAMRVDALLMDFLLAPTDLQDGRSRYHWRNDEFSKAYKSALAEADQAKRLSYFHEAQRIAQEDGNIIIPTFSNVVEAQSSKVQGYVPHSTYHWRQWWNISLKQA